MQSDVAATLCPTDDVLGALVCNALPPDEAARIAAHLDDCVTCQEVAIAAVRDGATPLPASATGPTGPANAIELLARAPTDLQIGRYELNGLLGGGGMGAVYSAYDAELDRDVALKVLRPELSESPGLADRLVYESRLMARIAHPAVITVYDVGRQDHAVFIAMELIRGATLKAWLAAHRLSWRAIVAVFERAGGGLAAAHRAGIVHRDFKPENVLVADGADKVVVTDFGIAREAGDRADLAEGSVDEPARPATLTTDGAVVGTPAYMAPEQIAGRRIDHRADVFAFSTALWEAVFGARPFPGANIPEIFEAMQRPPRPPAGVRVPGRLVRALLKGLALEPRDRWPEMAALLDELAAIRARRARVAMVAAATGLVCLGVTAALVAGQLRPAADPCARGLVSLDAAYNPRLAAQVHTALASDPAIQRDVTTKLGAAADAWRATQRTTCRADREVAQDAQVTACLDARRLELGGAVDDLITDGTQGASYASTISRLVGDPAACATPAPGLVTARIPLDRPLRRQVTALRHRLTDAYRAFDRGDFAEASAQTAPVVAVAGTLWLPLYAEAQSQLGMFQRRHGDIKRGMATLIDAADTAQRIHDDAIAMYSWLELAQAAAFDQNDPRRGLEYIGYAETAASQISRSNWYLAQIAYVKGSALSKLDRYPEAEAALRKSIALARSAGDADNLARAIQGLGIMYEAQGRYRDAVAAYREAIDSEPRSPSGQIVGRPSYFQRLSITLALLGRTSEAEVAARRGVELADRTLPETKVQRTYSHLTLAEVLLDVGKSDEALAEAAGAVATLARSHGPRSAQYAAALSTQGEFLVYLGRYREAEPLLKRACDTLAFVLGDSPGTVAACEVTRDAAAIGLHHAAVALPGLDHAVDVLTTSSASPLNVSQALLTRGVARAALDHRAAAIEDFEGAIAMLTKLTIEPGYLAMAKWRLGRELWTDQPARARAEMLAGLALFETSVGRWAHERTDAHAWFAAHDRAASLR
jgi:tetratricopeptide (TPR) repeat protein/predicted Ser/Thr protein kinase